MYKIGICGHYGENQVLLNGQTIKTKTLTEELRITLGSDKVQTVDTHGWRRKPINLLIKCYQLIKDCKNIIILPAQNGVRVFVPLFLLINTLFHRKLHYVVIGGWLPELLKKTSWLKNGLTKFDGIYVETRNMVKALQQLGLQNVRYLPNFKRLEILDESELAYPTGEPYRLCTFSRVMKEKGIEDAVNAVISINNSLGRTVYTLDIYGQIDENYSDRFKELNSSFPDFISYKGSVEFSESVKVLKDYFALIFPTHFKTEGIPGTIIDAYAAGVPVLAANWEAAHEIIDNKKTGFIYDFMQTNKLEELLINLSEDVRIISTIKKNCLKEAEKYIPKAVVGNLLRYL